MKQFLITFIFVLPWLKTSGQEWYSFQPLDQPFSVMAPGEMKDGQKKLMTDVGTLYPTTWICEGKDDDPNNIYLVSYVDYPEGTFHSDSIELINEFLQVSIDTHVESLAGKLIYQSNENQSKYPTILYRANYNDGKAIVKSKVFLINDRFYTLQVYSLVNKSLNLKMDKFLNSFRIEKN